MPLTARGIPEEQSSAGPPAPEGAPMKDFRSCPRIRTLAVAATFAFVVSGCVLSSTGAPRIVADTSAVFTGAVKSSQGDTVTYWFAYGTTPSYGSTTTAKT